MAQESCNLDKDEAELLKPPSSTSSTTAAPPPPPATTAPTLFFTTPEDQKLGPWTDAPKKPDDSSPTTISSSTRKRKLEAPPSPPLSDAADCKARKVDSTNDAPSAAARAPVNRCSCCQKKVGLTGFRCRCGHLFCARHRYSDAHECSFDYKAAGRAEIYKANPVVRAPKIIKI